MHAHTRMYTHKTHTHKRTHICTHTDKCTQAYTVPNTKTRRQTHALTHTHTHSHTHTHTYTYTYTHAHIHTRTLVFFNFVQRRILYDERTQKLITVYHNSRIVRVKSAAVHAYPLGTYRFFNISFFASTTTAGLHSPTSAYY